MCDTRSYVMILFLSSRLNSLVRSNLRVEAVSSLVGVYSRQIFIVRFMYSVWCSKDYIQKHDKEHENTVFLEAYPTPAETKATLLLLLGMVLESEPLISLEQHSGGS
jgi:hypothetical protein